MIQQPERLAKFCRIKMIEGSLKKTEVGTRIPVKARMIFNATGTAAVIIEEDTTISLVNSEFETLSGYSKEEIEGKKRQNRVSCGAMAGRYGPRAR